MSETARKVSEMMEHLADDEQRLVLQLVKKMIPEDIATEDDLEAIEQGRLERERGELTSHNDIDWS